MRASKHGHSNGHPGRQTPTYSVWLNMRRRCLTPTNPEYFRYGGRGITICARWDDFTNFLHDMGEKPRGRSIDRYPNMNGNYELGNCRWATPEQQTRNTRNIINLEYQGETKQLVDWSDAVGIDRGTLYYRIRRGWTVDRALTTPVQARGNRQRKAKQA